MTIQKDKVVITGLCVLMSMLSVTEASDESHLSTKGGAVDTQAQQVVQKLDTVRASQDLALLADVRKEIESLAAQPEVGESGDGRQHRREVLSLWLNALDCIDQMTDPSFDATDVPQINVAPPGSGFRAGVAPSEINDPELRAAYERSIAQNVEKAKKYQIQKKLQNVNRTWSARVRDFIKTQYTTAKEDTQEVEALADRLLSNNLRRMQIRTVLSDPAKKD